MDQDALLKTYLAFVEEIIALLEGVLLFFLLLVVEG